MSEINKFALSLEDELSIYMPENNFSKPQAFTHCLIERLKDSLSIDDYTMAYNIKKNIAGSVLGEIFGFSISKNKEVLSLFYSEYDDNAPKQIGNMSSGQLQSIYNRLQGFYKLCINGSLDGEIHQDDPLYELYEFLNGASKSKKKETVDNLVTVRLIIFSNSFIKDSSIKNNKIKGKNVVTELYDISKLYQLMGDHSDHRVIDIDFDSQHYNYKLPYIEMEAEGCDYKCFLTVFPGKLLYSLYSEYNTDLLLNNVRYFLGFKGSEKNNANIGILQTLREEKHMFLAYNNGIVALAESVEDCSIDSYVMEEDGIKSNDEVSSGILKAIKDFQIVNGGQTTAAIFSAKQQSTGLPISLAGVYVPVKIVVIKNENKKKEAASNITKYSNSQNKIKYGTLANVRGVA